MLDFFAEARGITSTKKRDHIDRVINICDLSSVAYKPISKLSKGFKQRVGMSQALLHDPDVLILDEPTAGLDPNQIRGVRDTMRRLAETKTILLSTHILQEVEAMADRVVMINEGRLVYEGDVETLRNSGNGDLNQAFHSLTHHDIA
jgi:ABC-2 type transport system ATP-binding protein